MTKDDEKELFRLTEVLRTMHEKVGNDVLASEALKKAALALSVGFIHGLRTEIERFYSDHEHPLSGDDRARLANLDIPHDDEEKE